MLGSLVVGAGTLFIGETTLLQSIWATLRATRVQAVVQFGTPEHGHGRERRRWAQDLRTAVATLRDGDSGPGDEDISPC